MLGVDALFWLTVLLSQDPPFIVKTTFVPRACANLSVGPQWRNRTVRSLSAVDETTGRRGVPVFVHCL